MMQSMLLEQLQTNLLKLSRLLEQSGVEPKPQIAGGWAEGKDVMKALNISRRTLQTLRDNGTLGYSRLGGKYYYRIFDIEDLLRNNYVMFRLSAHGKTEDKKERGDYDDDDDVSNDSAEEGACGGYTT